MLRTKAKCYKIIIIQLLLISIVFNTNSQEFFYKNLDIGEEHYNDIGYGLLDLNDTIYFCAFNPTFYEDGTYVESSIICKALPNGDLIDLKKYVWLDPDSFTIFEQEKSEIIVADGIGRGAEPLVRIFKFDKETLDSISVHDYHIQDSMVFLAVTSLNITSKYYILSCYGKTKEDIELNFPEYLLWVDKETMELDTILHHPNSEQSILYTHGFVDKEDHYVVYYHVLSHINSTRGFMKYNNNKEIIFHYQDTLDKRTDFQYPHAAVQLQNGDLVYKQDYEPITNPPYLHRSDFDVIRVDGETGEIVWRFNTPGTLQPYGYKSISHLTTTDEGDIIGCGEMSWHFGLEEDGGPLPEPPTSPRHDMPYIIKIDGETGEEVWEYGLITFDEYGNVNPRALLDIEELSDGSLLGVGYYEHFDSNGDRTEMVTWIVRLPSDGCPQDSTCTLLNFLSSNEEVHFVSMNNYEPYDIFPNPSHGVFTVLNKEFNAQDVTLLVRGINGDLLYNQNVNLTDYHSIDITSKPSGVYIFEIWENDKPVHKEKVIKK